MQKIEEILELLSDGRNFPEISKILKTTTQNVQIRFKNYVQKNKSLQYPCDRIIYKIHEPKKNRIRVRATLLSCQHLFLFDNRYLIHKKFQKKNQSHLSEILAETLIENEKTDIHDFLQKINVQEKDIDSVEKIIHMLYPKRIIFVKDYVIYAKKLQFLKFINIVSELYTSLEELYLDLKDSTTTKIFFEEENIKCFNDLQKRVQYRPLNSKDFIRTCNANWELKRVAKKIENEKQIIELSETIVKDFFCGFHIDILYQKLLKKEPINFTLMDYRVLLLESKKFMHYKGHMIKQVNCEKIQTNKEALLLVLEYDKSKDIETIVNGLKEKGRNLTQTAILVAMSNLKKEGYIKVEKKQDDDKKFKESTGFPRKKSTTLYKKIKVVV